MKCLPRNDERVASALDAEPIADTQRLALRRAFFLAHGHVRGPLSTLTPDSRVRFESETRRALHA